MGTQKNFLTTCDPNLKPLTASYSKRFTPRRAVDSTGHVGFLYDACRDQVLDNSKLSFTSQVTMSQKSPQCFTDLYNINEAPYLLDFISMHHDLQLSIALEMTSTQGVGALINYSRSIDKYTRFIFYTYYGQTDYISDTEFEYLTRNRSSISDPRATHVIVLVNWGIDATVVVQLPPDDNLIKAIDNTIQKLCISLSTDHVSSDLSEDDICYLDKIVHTQVFSNIPSLTEINSLTGFCYEVPQIRKTSRLQYPYNYNLCAVQHLCNINNTNQSMFNELPLKYNTEIRHYLLRLSRELDKQKKAIAHDYSNLQKHLKQQYDKMHARWAHLEDTHKHEIQRLGNSVIDIRRGRIDQTTILKELNSTENKELIKSMDDFDYDLSAIQEKEVLIGNLLQKHFEYLNAADYGIENGDTHDKIKSKLSIDVERTYIICFNHNLYSQNASIWSRLCDNVLEKRKANPDFRYLFVDFTYCTYTPDQLQIWPPTEKKSDPISSNTATISQPEKVTEKKVDKNNDNENVLVSTTALPSQQMQIDETINILLLGESGVGKSTFINALVNYLKFDTLEKAQKNPTALIPVSFIITTGDDFKERHISFGGPDHTHNEDFEQAGQSVTQHCKSYVFTLKDEHDSRKKLRIIDTPGIGDTRGTNQDDINMQHILSYITNLTHLNAICILMKPNNTRLNIFFRSCFMQLFDMLGENARDKIIFCFTNSRSTFYTPGNTAPILKKLLESIPGKIIPFTKHNTFCFDSESFRYLVAVQHQIPFSGSEEKEYKDSWNRSSTEAEHLLKYIRGKLTVPLISGELRSMKHAQLRTNLMIRPMLEAMRNILRNMTLSKSESCTISVQLNPESVDTLTAICFECTRESYSVGEFWITSDCLHVFQNTCRTCRHKDSQHLQIYYELKCKDSKQQEKASADEMKHMLDDLCRTSAQFAHFVFEAKDNSGNDPFLLGLKRMIKEENDICETKKPCERNLELRRQLEQLQTSYESIMRTIIAKKDQMILSAIYEKIEHVCRYRMIQLQMNAIKESQKMISKLYEQDVST